MQVSLCFVLMSRRRAADYAAVLKCIKQHLESPNLLQGLDSKLLLFRKGLIGIASDIEKMYHQVSL